MKKIRFIPSHNSHNHTPVLLYLYYLILCYLEYIILVHLAFLDEKNTKTPVAVFIYFDLQLSKTNIPIFIQSLASAPFPIN